MAGQTEYYRDVWEPMTLMHYARGGVYCVVTAVRDGATKVGRIVGYEIGARLTVEEAVAYRGTVRIFFCQHIVNPFNERTHE
jgi:hypothetical protein